MSEIKNSDAIRELIKGANLQTGFDEIPSKLANAIVPTLEINPEILRKANIFKSAVASNAISATIYTTPTDRDFYLTNVDVNVYKDATSTSTYSGIEVYPFGLGATELFQLATLTLTAQDKGHSFNLAFPFKLARGSTIKVINSTNVANIRTYGTIIGYIDEMSRS